MHYKGLRGRLDRSPVVGQSETIRQKARPKSVLDSMSGLNGVGILAVMAIRSEKGKVIAEVQGRENNAN